MGKEVKPLRFRKVYRLIFRPFMFLATLLVYLLFDVTWEQAKSGEL